MIIFDNIDIKQTQSNKKTFFFDSTNNICKTHWNNKINKKKEKTTNKDEYRRDKKNNVVNIFFSAAQQSQTQNLFEFKRKWNKNNGWQNVKSEWEWEWVRDFGQRMKKNNHKVVWIITEYYIQCQYKWYRKKKKFLYIKENVHQNNERTSDMYIYIYTKMYAPIGYVCRGCANILNE